jgi:hypothetical protein
LTDALLNTGDKLTREEVSILAMRHTSAVLWYFSSWTRCTRNVWWMDKWITKPLWTQCTHPNSQTSEPIDPNSFPHTTRFLAISTLLHLHKYVVISHKVM